MKTSKKIVASIFALIIGFSFVGSSCASSHNTPSYSTQAVKAQKEYKSKGYNYKNELAVYTPHGDYFNSSKKNYDKSRITTDKNGIIMVKYNDVYRYNPVTVAQVALTNYGKYVTSKNAVDKNEFLKYANALIGLQGKDGALRYNFPFRKDYLHVRYQSGWVSAMAQGQALSVYSRAYYLTGDVKYLSAGRMAFKFLNTPISRGGTLTTLEGLNKKYRKGQYFYYEEYISKPNNYTLNGYMFTLIGIYDWSNVVSKSDMGQKEAKRMFGLGIRSLVEVLPLHDIKGFTSYDLSGITMKQSAHIVPNYHEVHIYQLYTLYTITKNPTLLKYYKLWASYVN